MRNQAQKQQLIECVDHLLASVADCGLLNLLTVQNAHSLHLLRLIVQSGKPLPRLSDDVHCSLALNLSTGSHALRLTTLQVLALSKPLLYNKERTKANGMVKKTPVAETLEQTTARECPLVNELLACERTEITSLSAG